MDHRMLDKVLALLQDEVPHGMTVLVETEAGFFPTVAEAQEALDAMREEAQVP